MTLKDITLFTHDVNPITVSASNELAVRLIVFDLKNNILFRWYTGSNTRY
jgi:hypothetical protein